jgi:LacI family transcriptional regulator
VKPKRKVLVVLGWHDARVLIALARHARAAGWHLETRHFFDETLPQGWHGDGMIVSNPARRDMLEFIQQQAPEQPTVLIEGNNPGLRVPQVAEDNRAAGRLVAEHFLELGHKHFVWWSPYGGGVAEDRLAGFQKTLEGAGHSVRCLDYHRIAGSDDWSLRREWLGRCLQSLPLPTALFALDDQLAAEAVEMCLESGLRVPEDVAVVGVGNIELACETSHVPITSVDNAPEEVALAGARLLEELMAGGRAPVKPILIPPRSLVVRQSSSALAATHPGMIRVAEHIRKHLAEPLDIARLAAAAGVSQRTLYHLFRTELRCTPAEFLCRERMTEARRLIQESRLPIKDIVAACGFGTVRTMNRVFLRIEGDSPREWKKRNGARHSIFNQT